MQSKCGTAAATVSTETFSFDEFDSEIDVEVLNLDGTGRIYFTVDGTAPTVGGDNTYVVPAAIGGLSIEARSHGTLTIKLISSGTPAYVVTVI